VNYAQWKTCEDWQKLLEVGKSSYFAEMGNLQNPMLTFTKSAINLIRIRTGDDRLTSAPAKGIPL
jgi:hypothetical protein